MSAEILVSWGDFSLCQRRLGPGERFVVGDDDEADVAAPAETHVVSVARNGAVSIEARGVSRPCDGSERIELGPLSLRVWKTNAKAARFSSRRWAFDLGVVVIAGLYGALVALVSPSAWLFVNPTRETLDIQMLSRPAFGFSFEPEPGDSLVPPERLASASSAPKKAIFAETRARFASSVPRRLGLSVPRPDADQRRGGTGARSRAAEGAIGSPYAPPGLGTWAMSRRESVHLAKQRRPERSFVFAWFNPEAAHDEELVAEWGDSDEDAGEDEQDVVGNMLGEEPVDPAGPGLGVLGVRRGGGGEAKSLGLGRTKLGHGRGSAPNDGRGVVDAATFRRNVGRATHVPTAPSLGTAVAPDVVERVLSRAREHFRACGASDASVAFDVGPDGSPTNAVTPNACVTRVLSRLSFLPAGNGPTRVRAKVGSWK